MWFQLIALTKEDVSFWRVLMEGPPQSPFEGGIFALDVLLGTVGNPTDPCAVLDVVQSVCCRPVCCFILFLR